MDINLAMILIACVGSLCLFLLGVIGWGFRYHRQRLSIILKSQKEQIEKAVSRSRSTQKGVAVGLAVEKFAPFLPEFPLLPPEVQFLGKPVDYIGFQNLDEEGREIVIHFVEVKTGSSWLSERQERIRQAIEAGRVVWTTYYPMAKQKRN